MDGSERNRRADRVFISYSRTDAPIVDDLARALRSRQIEISIDRTDIEKFEDWWKRVQNLITAADVLLFAISPDSVRSEICQRELDFALSLKKRIAPVLVRPIEGSQLPETLRRINYFSLAESSGPDPAAEALAQFISSDIEWVREHTRLGELAIRWDATGRPGSLQLRGKEIATAEEWRDRRPAGAPELNDKQIAFISSSRQAAIRRQRYWLGGSLAATIGFALLAALAYVQRNEALSTESRFLAGFSQQERAQGEAGKAMALAWYGSPHRSNLPW
jgi:hypothetical protein